MTKDKWISIVGNIKDNFEVIENEKEKIDEDGGIEIEYIVFQSPLGKIRLEHIEKPIILDKKTIYSRRIGSDTKVDYIYSDSETSSQMLAYKWSDEQDDWIEIDPANFEN